MRAIQIQPDALEGPVVCIMKNIKSDEDIKFVALSYVWGDAEDQIKITLNNKPFHVTRNLHEALLQLRAWSQDRAFDDYLHREDWDGGALWL